MPAPDGGSLRARLKLPLLLLVYPTLACLLANLTPPADSPDAPRVDYLKTPVNIALFVMIAFVVLFLAAVPQWASRYRQRPLLLTSAFRRGLWITAILIAVVLPIQGLLVALALFIADPKELWFWGVFTTIGAVVATVVLLRSGLGKQPGVYLTIRATKIDLDGHPKLADTLTELAATLGIPWPQHVLVGLQPEVFWSASTVFCPDGELEGGVLCFSLSSSAIMSIPEFRALAGEALLGLDSWLKEGRTQFLSTSDAAREVVNSLDDTMRQFSWWPRWVIHPVILAFRTIMIAAMRFPLYLGKEMLIHYLKEFWASRSAADVSRDVQAHYHATSDVGSVQVISALIKQAAVCLGGTTLNEQSEPVHALGEVVKRIIKEHPGLKFARSETSSSDPVSAWQYLQFRCTLSNVSLEWCRQLALDVSPEPSATSLFEDADALRARIVEILESPFVSARQRVV